MKLLFWIVRIYTGLLILWALSSWFGGLPLPLGAWLNWLMWPVWKLFGWAVIGNIYLGGVIAFIILMWIGDTLGKKAYPRAALAPQPAQEVSPPPSDRSDSAPPTS